MLESIQQSDTPIYRLSDEQKEVIRIAKEQIKTGEYLTEEEANREIEIWLEQQE